MPRLTSTDLPKQTVKTLEQLAKANLRSLSAEVTLAIQAHLIASKKAK